MAAEAIGTIRCGICGSPKARVSLSKRGLAVITCHACNTQAFARSERSDELVRANLVPCARPANDGALAGGVVPGDTSSGSPTLPASPPPAPAADPWRIW